MTLPGPLIGICSWKRPGRRPGWSFTGGRSRLTPFENPLAGTLIGFGGRKILFPENDRVPGSDRFRVTVLVGAGSISGASR